MSAYKLHDIVFFSYIAIGCVSCVVFQNIRYFMIKWNILLHPMPGNNWHYCNINYFMNTIIVIINLLLYAMLHLLYIKRIIDNIFSTTVKLNPLTAKHIVTIIFCLSIVFRRKDIKICNYLSMYIIAPHL